MTRSMTNTLLLVVTPLILVALLSSAFNDMMSKYEDGSEIVAGYRIEGGQISTNNLADAFKDAAAQNGYVLREYPTGDPGDIIREEKIGGFVTFGDGTYTVYQNNDYIEEAKVLEYFVNAFYENAAAAAMGMDTDSAVLKIEHPEYMKEIGSTDYYGIIEIIYFGWCAIVCGAGIFMNEKKYKITKKLHVSALSESKLYLAKFVPIVSVVLLGNVISILLSIVLFGVHWGNPLLSAVIVFFSASAATALGLMAYYIFDNIVVTIIAVFTVVWVAGFFGGSFETYMFSVHSLAVKRLSPIYHINRALVELSCMGHSDYVVSAILYCVAVFVGCSLVAVAAGNLRKRGGAA